MNTEIISHPPNHTHNIVTDQPKPDHPIKRESQVVDIQAHDYPHQHLYTYRRAG